MNLEKINSLGARILFVGASLLLAVGILEFVVNLFGFTFLRVTTYTPGRLLELADGFLLFVIVLLLRQMREELKKPKAH